MPAAIAEAKETVLSTLNKDGTRRWLLPTLSRGRFLIARRVTAYVLIAIFTVLPFLRINGKPAILLDIVRRRFTIFGFTFLPTDTLLLALFVLCVVLSIFLLTALFGRVWCGWACPQTVYMEFVFRPIERLFEGPPTPKGALAKPRSPVRTVLRFICYFLVSGHLANTFLAYFVGTNTLYQWTQQSPLQHPTPFLIVAFVTCAMMFDFSWFREQTCIVACPYGRLQSVLLDRKSLIVTYDRRRGEPRGKARKAAPASAPRGEATESLHRLPLPQLPNHLSGAAASASQPAATGDCVDCGLCFSTCPTGIDIRNGLQLECIGCAQCIDACNNVMTRLKRPRGLIRYSSQSAVEGEKRSLLRPRVVIYPLLLTVVATLWITLLLTRPPADVTILRGMGNPFTRLPDDVISNTMVLKIANRTEQTTSYTATLLEPAGQLAPESPRLTIDGGEIRDISISIRVPHAAFKDGECWARVRVSDGHDFQKDVRYKLLGPFGSAPTSAPASAPAAGGP